jgi:hypothetical protein
MGKEIDVEILKILYVFRFAENGIVVLGMPSVCLSAFIYVCICCHVFSD